MHSYRLSGFLDILKDSIKIVSSNGRLVAFTAIIFLVLDSVFFLLNTFSTRPFIYDLVFKLMAIFSARPGTPEYADLLVSIRQDIGFFLGIQALCLLPFFFIALVTKTAIVFVSSSLYNKNDLSLKELISKVSRSWTRPFFTAICVQLLSLGYGGLFFLPFLIPTLVLYDHSVPLIAVLVLLAIVYFTLFLYLSVTWFLGIVVSVVENVYGISAIGKAKELVTGKRLHGFLVNLLVNVITMAVILIGLKLQPTRPITMGLIQVSITCLAYMFQSIAYSVLYFQCKNNQKKSGSGQYDAIPTAPLEEDYIP